MEGIETGNSDGCGRQIVPRRDCARKGGVLVGIGVGGDVSELIAVF